MPARAVVDGPVGRQRKDVIRNRRRLLVAADDLAAERGLPISFNALAHRAGVGVGTVYRHFTDPDALLDALIEIRIDRIVSLFERCEAIDDPIDALRDAILGVGELQSRDRGIWAALVAAPHRLEPIRARLQPPTNRLIERARSTGRLSPDFSLTDYIAMLWVGDALSGWLGRVDPGAWRRYVEALLVGFGVSNDPVMPFSASSISLAALDRALDLPRRQHPTSDRPAPSDVTTTTGER